MRTADQRLAGPVSVRPERAGDEGRMRVSVRGPSQQKCSTRSLRMYNSLVERCFKDCVDTFRRKDLDAAEEKVRAGRAEAGAGGVRAEFACCSSPVVVQPA